MRSIRNRRRLNEEIGITTDDVKAAFEKAGIKVRYVDDDSHQFGDGWFSINVTSPARVPNGTLVLKSEITGNLEFHLNCHLCPVKDSYDSNTEDDVIEFLKRFKKTRAILEDMVEALGDIEFKHKDI